MLRLIAFGCSNTWGHCLPDAVNWEKNSRTWGISEHPSRFAFPQLIADHFDIECINLGYPGSSNRYIWYQMLNFDFEETDIVICTWTFTNRHYLIMPHKSQHLGCWPSMVPANRNFQKFVASSNSKKDLDITACLYMDHALNYVTPKVKCILNYKVNRHEVEDKPDWCNIEFIRALDEIVSKEEQDYAEDNLHYGVESHKRFAKQMIEDLTSYANLDV